MLPVPDENIPAEHSEDADSPIAGQYDPGGQVKQLVPASPRVRNLPTAHEKHAEAPAVLTYLPAAHAAQAVAPFTDDARPAAQSTQLEAPLDEYIPARQPKQPPEPVGQAEVHAAASSMLVVPGAHTTQEADDVPSEDVPYHPAPHRLQLELPVFENLPATQELHDLAPVVATYLPASHEEHKIVPG